MRPVDGADLQRHYSGYLSFDMPSEERRGSLANLAKEASLFDLSHRAIEIEYIGRDTNRVVERALVRLAEPVGNAEGEVRCEVSGDADQLWFEFIESDKAGCFANEAT